MEAIRPSEKHNLYFEKTITKWDEAIPLGNGRTGALVWGDAKALRFSLDRADIWDTTPCETIFTEEFTYENMVRLAREGKEEEIRKIFDAPYNFVTPCKLPAGKLILHMDTEESVRSQLGVEDAKADILAGDFHVESFIHAERNFGMIRINHSRSEFSYTVENPEFGIKTGEESGPEASNSTQTAALKKLHYPAPEKYSDREKSWFIQEISEHFSYGIFVVSREYRSETQLAFCVAASVDRENWKEKALSELKEALETGYETMFREHCRWWRDFWGKSGMNLPDFVMEKNWYMTNYILASCSRKGGYPMQLQGLWTADDGQLPPWKGDYHHDLNTQLSYYHYLKANHLEEGESFLDFLWNMRDVGKKFAKSFYKADGMCIPSVMAIDGTALGGWGMYSLSPTNQIWLAQSFERYYRVTGNMDFLRERAYPYMKETAECILSLLEEKEGLYYLPISSSPEIHDDTIRAFVTPNSNYDLALMRYLFSQLSDLAEKLENGEKEKWEEVYAKLPELAVDESGILMISPDEMLLESHRHFSHLMAIHPLCLLNPEKEEEKKVIDASVHSLERLGSGNWTGYTFAWMAELYAVQKNGNGAAHKLRTFWDCFCSQNGFHLNGDYKNTGTSSFHYRPFTLEGNMCAADALQEMLLQTKDGIVELFPAIPDEWKEKRVAFFGLRAENGIIVSAEMKNGKIKKLDLDGGEGEIKLRKCPELLPLAERYGWQTEEDCYIIKSEKQ